jgi:hypothetical protein
MAIENYYKSSFTLKRKTRATTSGGVSKETLSDIATFSGIIDPAGSMFNFRALREEYDFTDTLFCGIEDIRVDDIVDYDGTQYNVVSVINPMNRNHHLELLLKRMS